MRPVAGLGMPLAMCDARDLEGQREEACTWAKEWLSWRAPCCERPAAVFDIDATLLHDGARIESVIALYDYARAIGVKCFFVTARSSDGKAFTYEEFQRLRIEPPRHLFMHPKSEPLRNSTDAGRRKHEWRRRIERKGYTIVLNVGDAFSDHYAPPDKQEVRRAVGNLQCAVFVDGDDGVAHLKLGHPS